MASCFHTVFPATTPLIQPTSGVDIWLIKLTDITATALDKASVCLSAEELHRAAGISHKPREFIATRAFVRLCLAQYTHTDASTLRFATHAKGKPYLVNADFPLHFSISHSGDFLALAVSKEGAVGIDIETNTKRNIMAIAHRYFHCDEVARLEACAGVTQTHLFFQLWTLKEAFFKALGTGISAGLDKVCFATSEERITPLFAPDPQTDVLVLNEKEWQFHHATVADSAYLSIARHLRDHATSPMPIAWYNGKYLFDVPG